MPVGGLCRRSYETAKTCTVESAGGVDLVGQGNLRQEGEGRGIDGDLIARERRDGTSGASWAARGTIGENRRIRKRRICGLQKGRTGGGAKFREIARALGHRRNHGVERRAGKNILPPFL